MERLFLSLVDGLDIIEVVGNNCQVDSIEYDSRKVKPGAVFCALPGLHVDGKSFIQDAIQKGATAILHEAELTDFVSGVCYARVKDVRFAMSYISAQFYDEPSKKLKVIGVTGTEGKSSTVSFIWQLLNLLGEKCGYFSTVSYAYGGIDTEEKNPEHQTTPESCTVQERLYRMQEAGSKYAVVESSSHGLSEKTARLAHVLFDAGVWLNVTEEHLEFHKTFENYRNDKANLFRKLDEHDHKKCFIPMRHLQSQEQVGTCSCETAVECCEDCRDCMYETVPSFCVINLDDVSANWFSQVGKTPKYGFTVQKNNAKTDLAQRLPFVLVATNIVETTNGICFTLEAYSFGTQLKSDILAIPITVPLVGYFNVQNVLASILTVMHISGIAFERIIQVLASLKPITGRMFFVNEGQDFTVIIDYAHTPSSFETIMPSLATATHRTGKKLISVFGSGGERDTTKRPEQGRIASQYCDIVILADEDPRGEDSMELLNMIAAGVQGKELDKTLFLIPDRKAAIRKAFSLCEPGDMVLLLGKGHENSIIFKDYVMPYDEETEARCALKELLHANT